jgi:hypothetical protein
MANLDSQQPAKPLSKDLPHDWKEQRRFLGLAA